MVLFEGSCEILLTSLKPRDEGGVIEYRYVSLKNIC